MEAKGAQMTDINTFLDDAIALAFDNIDQGGRPFGAVVVKDGKVVARGVNRMQADNDPTAHAELLALREAGRVVNAPRLDGCSVYASGQPCPMCLAAMRMAGIKEIFFAYSNEQADPFGLSTAGIAAELSQPLKEQSWASIKHVPRQADKAPHLYEVWATRSSPKK